jgi:hypothetical protein
MFDFNDQIVIGTASGIATKYEFIENIINQLYDNFFKVHLKQPDPILLCLSYLPYQELKQFHP